MACGCSLKSGMSIRLALVRRTSKYQHEAPLRLCGDEMAPPMMTGGSPGPARSGFFCEYRIPVPHITRRKQFILTAVYSANRSAASCISRLRACSAAQRASRTRGSVTSL